MISLTSKLLLVGIAAAAVAIPPLQSRVTDLTSTLDASQREALEKTLAEFEARKGAQLAVLVFLFSKVLDLGIADDPVFVFTGLIVWSWFQVALTEATRRAHVWRSDLTPAGTESWREVTTPRSR